MAHINPTFGQSASELKHQIEQEREGLPFLVLRDPAGQQRLVALAERERVAIGREEGVGVAIAGDPQVSRLHAELELVGGSWVIADEGLSRNGTFVNGERVSGRRRLHDRDLIQVGDTGLLFRAPAMERAGATVASTARAATEALTDTQRSVLVALCRPYASGDRFATPATNREIAESVFLSVDAVKGHLRVLFERFGLAELPQNEKRVRLAEQALRSGAVRVGELG